MAKHDFRIYSSPYATVPTQRWQTEAASTAIYEGEPVKLNAAGSPYAIACVNGDITVGTDTVFLGFAASDGTHTSAADGTVEVYMPLPGIVYAGKATTAANFNTAAEIAALCGDRVTLDLTSTTWTVDENEGETSTSEFYIVGGDPERAEVYFSARVGGTYLSL